MDLGLLHTFAVAADEMNFTRAARRLGISQPAVSLKVRELENRLEVELFERRGRAVLLTPAGERLKGLAREILAHVEQVRGALEEFRSTPQGVVRVGGGTSLGIYLLPQALGAFARAYPGVRVTLQVGKMDDLVRALADGHLDLALAEEPPAPQLLPGWEAVPVMEDELVLIASPDDPVASTPSLRVADLPKSRFIMRDPGSATRERILSALAALGVSAGALPIAFELGNTEGIKQSVMAGLGLGWVSRFAVLRELEAKALVEVPIEGLRIQRHLWLLRPPPDQKSPHAERFCELIQRGKWLPPLLRTDERERARSGAPT